MSDVEINKLSVSVLKKVLVGNVYQFNDPYMRLVMVSNVESRKHIHPTLPPLVIYHKYTGRWRRTGNMQSDPAYFFQSVKPSAQLRIQKDITKERKEMNTRTTKGLLNAGMKFPTGYYSGGQESTESRIASFLQRKRRKMRRKSRSRSRRIRSSRKQRRG